MSNQDKLLQANTQKVKPRIFKYSNTELIKMFNKEQDKNARLTTLRELKYADGILKGINSEQSTGIVGDQGDLLRRKAVYGANRKPLPPPSSIVDSFKQEVRNLLWVVIGATAIIAAFCGIYAKGGAAILEGIFLLVFAFLMILLNSVVDWQKDKKFIQLQSLLIDEKCTVTRGKFGSTEQISVWSLVVGDVIYIAAGQRVPGDCLVLESSDFKVDENIDEKFRLSSSQKSDGQSGDIQLDKFSKAPYFSDADTISDPFVRADSLCTGGSAKLLVCCTGEKSTRGVVSSKLEDDSLNTKLQDKLKNLGSQFTNYSIIACFIIFVVLITMSVVSSTIDDGNANEKQSQLSVTGRLFEALPANVNLFVVLVVVAIPEGLPLVIQISLAFSVLRMYRKDRILLRKQSALEKIAEANEFLIGKSNILTTGKMKVRKFHLEGATKTNNRSDTILNCNLKEGTVKLLQENILYNNNAYVQMGANKFVPVGDGTEVGLIKFLQNADVPVHTEIKKRYDINRVIAHVPLRVSNPAHFYTACAVFEEEEDNKFVHIHVKGAPDALVLLAQSVTGAARPDRDAAEILPLDEVNKTNFRDQIEGMQNEGLRVIAFAHAKMPREQWDQISEQNENKSNNDILTSILIPNNQSLGLNIFGAIGLYDKVRPTAKSALKYAIGDKDDPRITVRMLTGDSRLTAQKVALQVGLITEDDIKMEGNVIMDAQQFDIQTSNGTDLDKVRQILTKLRVLAKCTPRHRVAIINGLKSIFVEDKCAKNVAVTGGAIADVESLNKADVALAMGSGCSAAKEVSDIVLTEDDFEATLRAVMWGRNIYHNVSRFLQFQVTVNLSCLLVVFVAPMVLGESPFSSVQLLWLNLVMDTLAAFALGTEPPLPNIAKGRPYVNQVVMRPQVWRQILGMTLWNFTIMMMVLFFAPISLNLKYFMADSAGSALTAADDAAEGTKKIIIGTGAPGPVLAERCLMKLRHCTYMYHIFVFLQLFNLINCRKDGPKDYNVFGNIFHNFYFLAVFCGEFAFQFLFPATMLRTVELGNREWGACLMMGATPLLISVLLKCTPERWLDKLRGGPCGIVNEEKKLETMFTKGFDRVNEMQVGGDKGASDDFKKVQKDEPKV